MPLDHLNEPLKKKKSSRKNVSASQSLIKNDADVKKRHYATIMRIRQLFREQKITVRLKRLEQTFLWKWNYSKVTCIISTPQIYLSRPPTGKKILWHIPTSRKDFFGTAEKNRFVFLLFGNHFFEVIEAQTEAEKAIPCETQVLVDSQAVFDECQIVAILQNLKSKDLSVFFFCVLARRRIEIILISDLPRIEIFCWNVFIYFQSIISCYFFPFSLSPAWIENNLKEEWIKWVHCASTRDWNIEGAFIVQNVINLIFGWVSLSSDPEVLYC